jgi:hypothetical protein
MKRPTSAASPFAAIITCLLEAISIVLQDFIVGLQDESFGRDLAARISLQSLHFADVENANFLKGETTLLKILPDDTAM